MRKRGKTYRILKWMAITICTPVILTWLLIVLLYVPPVQRYAVRTVCEEVGKASGFGIEMSSFHLSFPLKLNIADFKISRNDTTFAKGERAGVNISFIPLLSGEVEVNYVSLENAQFNTADLIEGIKADGEIGFFRIVARNIDLPDRIVNLRQIHLHSSDINLVISDTTENKEEESGPLDWTVRLHRGSMENCRFSIGMPLDTIHVTANLGKLRLKESALDLGKESYKIKALAISNSGISYDSGNTSKESAPLDHIELSNINLACRDIAYTPDSSKVEIERFTFVQPGGIRITETSALLVADRKELDVKRFSINSKNGSYINLTTTLPWESLSIGKDRQLKADLGLALNRRDLGALLTTEQKEAFSIFSDEMFKGHFSVNGNISRMNIDTAEINIPGIAELQAKGHASNIVDMRSLEASLDIRGKTGDLRKFITADANDSIPDAAIAIEGNLAYAQETAKAALEIEGIGGHISTDAAYGIADETYNADIKMNGLDITTILPEIPLNNLTTQIKAAGRGFDLFCDSTCYDVELTLDTLIYDNITLKELTLDASQKENISRINFSGYDKYLDFKINAETRLDKKGINNKTDINITNADLMMIGLTDAELATRMNIDIEASTDMNESHTLKINGKKLGITAQSRTFSPADIFIDFATTPEYSFLTATNGDLDIRGKMESGYNGLFMALDRISAMLKEAMKSENTLYYIHDYANEIPDISLNFNCGQKNMLHNFLAMKEIDFADMSLDLSLDSSKGINMNSGIYGFRSGEIYLDTIRMFTRQEGKKIRYLAGVRSTAVNPQQEKLTFSSSLYGNIFNDSITTNFMFRDRKEGVGIRFGAKTVVKPKELDITFRPDAVLFNNRFSFSENNYIKLDGNGTITADVTLSNEEDAGMHLYAMPEKNAGQSASLELFNVDLGGVTGMLPFVPEIAGMLNLELYFKNSKDEKLLSSDIRIDDVAYEGTPIGSEALEIVYFPKEENKHYLDVILSHNSEEVAHISGDYLDDTTDPGLQGEITLNRFPLSITHAFLKDAGMSLNGYVNSELTADGKLSKLSTNGFIQFDSVYINAPLFGTDLHLSDKNVNIKDNRISFRDFDIFAKGDTPFKLNGTVDLNKLANPAFNLRMNANNYELINAPRAKGRMLYGRMFIDFRAFIAGTLNSMKVYGNATLLGKSNITYVMQDAPIETDKDLDGLVEFVNFQDTTKVEDITEEADFGNMNISLGLKIEDGARINADLDENRNSYVMLRGGGNLNMTYTSDNGLNVTGTYAMDEGELKYELPIIPLKTFNITNGSKVTWNGDMLDPTLEITALERITTSVSLDDGGMQPVSFDVGVKLSNTLSNMGITFTISAPENAVVQDQLNSLDAETLNKYAVTMLITGTYIGNTKGMTVSNALSSFLDAKINDLAGSAMKSVSVDVGINDAENAETGSTYKNYSFSLKKRFLNDRLTIIIGGEVNSGDHPTTNDSFINNVSLEWKISDSSNRYLRLFYDKNYESLLEGEIIETGIGYIYKKKLENLKELFIFRKKGKKQKMPERDTIRNGKRATMENGK